MKDLLWLGAVLFLAWLPGSTRAGGLAERKLKRLNKRLCGQIVDHTHHHGADRRIWSDALCQWRNLYVYLPPGFDPAQSYPLVLWLHDYIKNERRDAEDVVPVFDKAIACGKLPPLIMAIPSGETAGAGRRSLFLNHKLGNYEDYIVHDIFGFMQANYPIRPERQAHALMGVSSGGWPAFSIAMKHRDCFAISVGLIPLLNPRWMDCHCNMRANFDPCCWGWRTKCCKNELLGIYYGFPVTLKWMVEPWFGWGDEAVAAMSRDNPTELLAREHIQPGDLEMYVAYVRKDQLNIDAAVESFLCTAKRLGLCVGVAYMPNHGDHRQVVAMRMTPQIFAWLAPRLAACPAPPPDDAAGP